METHHFLPLSQASHTSLSLGWPGSCLVPAKQERPVTISTKKVYSPGGTQSLKGCDLLFCCCYLILGFF
jgi:hypothetical protein